MRGIPYLFDLAINCLPELLPKDDNLTQFYSVTASGHIFEYNTCKSIRDLNPLLKLVIVGGQHYRDPTVRTTSITTTITTTTTTTTTTTSSTNNLLLNSFSSIFYCCVCLFFFISSLPCLSFNAMSLSCLVYIGNSSGSHYFGQIIGRSQVLAVVRKG